MHRSQAGATARPGRCPAPRPLLEQSQKNVWPGAGRHAPRTWPHRPQRPGGHVDGHQLAGSGGLPLANSCWRSQPARGVGDAEQGIDPKGRQSTGLAEPSGPGIPQTRQAMNACVLRPGVSGRSKGPPDPHGDGRQVQFPAPPPAPSARFVARNTTSTSTPAASRRAGQQPALICRAAFPIQGRTRQTNWRTGQLPGRNLARSAPAGWRHPERAIGKRRHRRGLVHDGAAPSSAPFQRLRVRRFDQLSSHPGNS